MVESVGKPALFFYIRWCEMNLQDPVTALSGVGEKRAETLANLGIETIEDLLSYYPFR